MEEATSRPATQIQPRPLFAVEDLLVDFDRDGEATRAIHGVSFDLRPGETLGLVGESGCGKSITALAALGLLGSTAKVQGSTRFEGREILGLDDRRLSALRGSGVGVIFQDPVAALNPVRSIGFHLREALNLHRNLKGKAVEDEATALLQRVGIPQPRRLLRAYPHQLSGGMNQRVMIALALAGQPRVLIADEPTTALDVTVQAQILSLIRRLRDESGMAVLLITHDLAVVAENCDRVAVMYAGRVVESGPVAGLFENPRHPYSRGLLAALPRLDVEQSDLKGIEGALPRPQDLPPGCAFAPRCPAAGGPCAAQHPPLTAAADGSALACFHPQSGPFQP
ncbi:MAG: ABC transporter ATP-binding protein [Rhodospirillales bacterium]